MEHSVRLPLSHLLLNATLTFLGLYSYSGKTVLTLLGTTLNVLLQLFCCVYVFWSEFLSIMFF